MAVLEKEFCDGDFALPACHLDGRGGFWLSSRHDAAASLPFPSEKLVILQLLSLTKIKIKADTKHLGNAVCTPATLSLSCSALRAPEPSVATAMFRVVLFAAGREHHGSAGAALELPRTQ